MPNDSLIVFGVSLVEWTEVWCFSWYVSAQIYEVHYGEWWRWRQFGGESLTQKRRLVNRRFSKSSTRLGCYWKKIGLEIRLTHKNTTNQLGWFKDILKHRQINSVFTISRARLCPSTVASGWHRKSWKKIQRNATSGPFASCILILFIAVSCIPRCILFVRPKQMISGNVYFFHPVIDLAKRPLKTAETETMASCSWNCWCLMCWFLGEKQATQICCEVGIGWF